MAKGYQPQNMVLWDSWFIQNKGKTHVFYLQAERQDNDLGHSDIVSIGHAVSDDLVHWQEIGTALEPGKLGAWDDLALWTGSVVENAGKFYMFYTGKNSEIDKNNIQKIGLATSEDLVNWQKHPDNPLLEANSAYYHMDNSVNKLGKIGAWRDPFVFFDPVSKQFCMTISARQNGNEKEYNACIALAVSDNLTDWQIKQPKFAPNKYDEMETSQVIIHKGRYYLFFSIPHLNQYEQQWEKQVGNHSGLHCYWSDDLIGEYQPVNGNGVVFEGAEEVYDFRLLPDSGDTYKAIGWQNRDKDKRLVGRLSEPYKFIIKEDKVKLG